MAQTKIRGNTQILDDSIELAQLASDLVLPLANVQDGTSLLKADGSVPLTSDWDTDGFKVTGLPPATAPSDALNLESGQDLVNQVSSKPSAKVVATTNLTLANEQTVNGVAVADGDYVLATGQTDASENGPWVVVDGGAWTRPAFWATASIQRAGATVVVTEGTGAPTQWVCTTTGTITVDTTDTAWSEIESGGGTSYTAGDGLDLTGTEFSVVADGPGLTVGPDGVKITDGAGGQVMLATSTGEAAFTTITGDIAVDDAGVASINTTAGTGFLKYDAFVANETPSGTVNGVNTTFTLANAPFGLMLYRNGQLLEPGVGNDYTISGTTITTLVILETGEKLRAYYFK
jgi:hypothetical protein